MADYNFILAKQIIISTPNIEEATMGMHEDWFWTATQVWSSESGFTEDFNKEILGGISGSYWATPVLELKFKDGTSRTIACHTGQTADELTRIEQSLFCASGCLSTPCQDHRDNISIEQPNIKAN